MQAKTNFSFEVQYAEHSDSTQPERDALWARLEAATFLTGDERRRMAGVGA